MVDLFAIAKTNGPLLSQKLENVKATKAAGEVTLLERFADRVQQHGRVAINMRTSEFSDLLLRGRHYNIYEWSQEQALISKRPVNMIRRERLGDYFEKRMAFDGAFVDGQKFRYGTLNVGGAGPVMWGQFCAVLKAEFAESAIRLAYVRGDSLNTYSESWPRKSEQPDKWDRCLNGA